MAPPAIFKNCGYQQITTLTTAQALTLPNGAQFAVVHAETQDVRWRDDGTDPTATVGMVIAAGATMRYDGELSRVRFIEAAVGAKLNVTFYG